MKKILLSCLFTLLFWTITNLAQAKLDDGQFILSAEKGRITLQAKNASVKKILLGLEEKTGLKVVVYEGVPDRWVTLDSDATPIHAMDTLLKQLSLRNTAIVYEEKLRSLALYVLPEGMDPSAVLQGKTLIRPATFPDPSKASKIKGRPVITTLHGKNNIPIRYVDGELLLKFHRGVTQEEIDAILSKYRLEKDAATDLSRLGYVKVRIRDGRNVPDVVKEIRKEHIIKVPEPNYIATPLTITDPLFSQQWYVPETRFDATWSMLKHTDTVAVAIIDTGVNGKHPDLKERVLKGYDFVNDKDDAGDDHGHGTFVAGIIAASANEIGIRGLYDHARILPLKAIDNQGLGTYEDVARGMVYAADAGARIINLSIGGNAYSYLLQDAVDYALEKGCILVAAGGNDGIEQQIYPAAYPEVIGVSALSYDGQIWSGSNSGKHVDVAAPGVGILSTGPGEDYVYATGTSAAASMVSALAAMLVSERSDLSSSVIEQLILQAAKDLGEKGRDPIYGSGEIDAQRALALDVRPFHDVAVRSVHVEPMVFEKGKPTYIVATIENTGTYKSENCDVALYEMIGEEKKQIVRQQGVNVIDKTRVIFEWQIQESKENVNFEVIIVSEKDADNSNNAEPISLKIEAINGLYILHGHPPHQIIAYKAYLLLPEIIKTGFSRYIGPATQPTDTDNNSGSTITEGTYDEDEVSRYCNHFWNTLLNPVDPDAGYDPPWYDTICTSKPYQSAYRRAQIFWDHYALPYYTGKDKSGNNHTKDISLSFWWLGRIAHLLTDISVPDHVHNDEHPLGVIGVGYESYIKDNCSSNSSCLWSQSGNPTVQSDLYNLFLSMAEKADNFDSGSIDGEVDGGSRRSLGFSDTEYRGIADVLMPEIYKHVAGLYKLFWENTHPDLTASAVVGSSYTSGQTGVQIPVTVTRHGSNLTQSTYVHARLYLSTNSTWDSGDTVLWWSNDSNPDFPNSMLNSNGSRTVTATINFTGVTSGAYYIIAFADAPTSSYPNGYHDEIDETNNTSSYRVTITQQTGTLSVTTTPVSGAIYFDGTFKANGFWSGSVATGSHTVSFGTVSGYTAPVTRTVTVYNGQTTTTTGTYISSVNASVTSSNAVISDVTVTDPIAGASSNYTPKTVVSFRATGGVSIANISISYSSLPADPVFFKVVNGQWKQIYPSNETNGITNVVLSGNILSFTIKDNYDCDGDPAVGVIQDPVVVCSKTTHLFFPHVATSIPWQTEIAIINTGDQTVIGSMRALSDEGQPVETQDVALPAHGRRQISIANEFTNHTDIGYIIFDTDSAAVQGYTKFYREGIYRAAIPAVKEVNTSDIYISHIASNAEWWTGVSLVNTTSETKELTMTFNNGQSRQIILTADQHRAFNIAQEFFNNQPQPDIQSAVIAHASGVIGLGLFGSLGWGTQLEGILLTDKTASTLYYPHAAGDEWWTGIVAYNPSDLSCTITITPYSDQGIPLTPSTRSLAGMGKYIGTVADLGLPTQTAWFKIDATRPLSGFELFGTADGNQLAAYAGGSGPAKAGVFAKIEKNGWTGIAFVNTEDHAASVTLTAYDDNGAAVATRTLSVASYAKVVNPAEGLFLQDISGATYIAYSSDRNVVGFQLNGSVDGTMLDGLPGLPDNITTGMFPSGTVQGRLLRNQQPVKGAVVYATELYGFDSTKFGSAITDSKGLGGIADKVVKDGNEGH